MSDERQPLDRWRLEDQMRALETELRERYLDRDQLQLEYVSKDEARERRARLRDWPVYFAAATAALAALTSVLGWLGVNPR